MTGDLRIHPAALEEAEAAIDWYRKRSPRAAGWLLDEFDRAVQQIVATPQRYPQYAFGTRQIVLQRFPFLLVYREAAEGVEVIAVAHARRRPYYWRDRIE